MSEWRPTRESCELLCEVGSGSHGLALEGTDDHDEMGVVIEPPEYVIGLRRWETSVIRDRAEGERSQPGDTDLVIHSLRKWMSLALNGNPTVIALFWAPTMTPTTDVGMKLRGVAPAHILSARALNAFLGYLKQQRERLMGERGQKRTKRPELVEAHGYDTKYAAHALRLGWQGIELATTGSLSFPMREREREYLRGVRRGEHELHDVLDLIREAEAELLSLRDTGRGLVLPTEPDRAWCNDFLVWSYERAWGFIE